MVDWISWFIAIAASKLALLVAAMAQMTLANWLSLLGGVGGALSAGYTWWTNRPRLWIDASLHDTFDPESDDPAAEHRMVSIDITNPTSKRMTIREVRLASYKGWRRFVPRATPNSYQLFVGRSKPQPLLASELKVFYRSIEECQNISWTGTIYGEVRHSGSTKFTRKRLRDETNYYETWRGKLYIDLQSARALVKRYGWRHALVPWFPSTATVIRKAEAPSTPAKPDRSPD